jgi:hypothetical protein
MINIEYIEAALRGMEFSRFDNECAHVDEDTLWREVLQSIADGTCEDPQACAKAALRSTEIVFHRWYA